MKKVISILIIILAPISTFSVLHAQELSDSLRNELNIMETKARIRGDRAEVILDDLIRFDYIFAFNRGAWEIASFAIQEGLSQEKFDTLLDRWYDEAFAGPMQMRAQALSATFTRSSLRSSTELTDAWIWNHLDLSFRNRDTIMCVTTSTSDDKAIALKGARKKAESYFAPMIRLAQNKADSDSVEIIGSFIAHQATRKSGSQYEAAVLVKLPMALNLE